LSGPVSWDGSTKNDVEYPIAWTPDGNDIAYGCDGSTDTTYDAGRVAQVCEVNVDTGAHHMITSATNQHPLSEGGGTNQRLSFTPDGKHIIATVLGETIDCLAGQPNLGECRVLEIASIDVASGAVKLLTTYDAETNRASSDAQLSPDGSSIVYFQVSDSSSAATRVDTGVAIMDSGGGNGHVIYSGYSPGATDPPYAESLTWSPDGKDVLFVSYGDGDDDYRLKAYLIAANGTGDPYKFTQDNYNVFDPSWAPVLTTCTVPDLKHKTLKHAKNELKKAACTLGKVKGPKKHRSKRKIVSQSPKANKEEPAGTKVNVTLG
jgi:Tol biopolymer transport system component